MKTTYKNLPNEMLTEIAKTLSKQNRVRLSLASKRHAEALRPNLQKMKATHLQTKFGSLWKDIAGRRKIYAYFEEREWIVTLADTVWNYDRDSELSRNELKNLGNDYLRTYAKIKYMKSLLRPYSVPENPPNLYDDIFERAPALKQKLKDFFLYDKLALLLIVRQLFIIGELNIFGNLNTTDPTLVKVARNLEKVVIKERAKQQKIRNLQQQSSALYQRTFKSLHPIIKSSGINWDRDIKRLEHNVRLLKKLQ